MLVTRIIYPDFPSTSLGTIPDEVGGIKLLLKCEENFIHL